MDKFSCIENHPACNDLQLPELIAHKWSVLFFSDSTKQSHLLYKTVRKQYAMMKNVLPCLEQTCCLPCLEQTCCKTE